MLNTTNPAKKLVPQLIRLVAIASLKITENNIGKREVNDKARYGDTFHYGIPLIYRAW